MATRRWRRQTSATRLSKTPDADSLREMICLAAERLMELEVGAAAGAAYVENSTKRMA